MTKTVTTTHGSFFVREGDAYAPTGMGVSTWNPRAQNGSVLAGLAGQLLDAVPTPVPMTPLRFTVDIYGAVPMEPLTPTIRLPREGKRIQIAELTLEAHGRTWVRAAVLRARTENQPARIEPLTRAFPDDRSGLWRGKMSEMLRIAGDGRTVGPGAAWVRIVTPMIAGVDLTSLARVAAAGDFGTSIAPPAAFEDWTAANLDLTLHLSRVPEGDWLLVDARNELAGNGVGMIHMRLGDRHGMIGTAHQGLYVDRR